MQLRALTISAGLLLATTTPAVADSYVIRACVNMSNGDVRLLLYGSSCPSDRTKAGHYREIKIAVEFSVQKIVEIEAAAQSRTRVGRMPR